jgi:hypothetical protein
MAATAARAADAAAADAPKAAGLMRLTGGEASFTSSASMDLRAARVRFVPFPPVAMSALLAEELDTAWADESKLAPYGSKIATLVAHTPNKKEEKNQVRRDAGLPDTSAVVAAALGSGQLRNEPRVFPEQGEKGGARKGNYLRKNLRTLHSKGVHSCIPIVTEGSRTLVSHLTPIDQRKSHRMQHSQWPWPCVTPLPNVCSMLLNATSH